jgi:hypothetical protein
LSNFHPTIFWERKFDHNILCLVKNYLITHTHLCDLQIVTKGILKTWVPWPESFVWMKCGNLLMPEIDAIGILHMRPSLKSGTSTSCQITFPSPRVDWLHQHLPIDHYHKG